MREIKLRARHAESGKWRTFSLDDLCNGHMTERYMWNDWREFTGLLDKNGVEVYEGDIVITNHELSRLKQGNWKPRPKAVEWVSTRYKIGFNIGNTNDENCEIIGNIYENPDLLKKTSYGSLDSPYSPDCSWWH